MFNDLTFPQLIFVAVALAMLAMAVLAFVMYGIANSPVCCALAFGGVLALSCFIE